MIRDAVTLRALGGILQSTLWLVNVCSECACLVCAHPYFPGADPVPRIDHERLASAQPANLVRLHDIAIGRALAAEADLATPPPTTGPRVASRLDLAEATPGSAEESARVEALPSAGQALAQRHPSASWLTPDIAHGGPEQPSERRHRRRPLGPEPRRPTGGKIGAAEDLAGGADSTRFKVTSCSATPRRRTAVPVRAGRARAEPEAESVAYVLLGAHGWTPTPSPSRIKGSKLV